MARPSAPGSARKSPLAGMTAVVLAGGLGTRLRSVVSDRPKVLSEVAGRPFLSYLLDELCEAGVERAVLCTGYLGDMIERRFGATYGRLKLAYSCESTPLGTGGALRAALPLIESRVMLVLNGDSLCRADLSAFVTAHLAKAAAASLLLTHVDNTSRYGSVDTDADGRVVHFFEKCNSARPGWINAGVYCLERRFVESIPAQTPLSLEREVFPHWLDRGLFGHRCSGPFIDIGTPESYALVAEFIRSTTPSAARRE